MLTRDERRMRHRECLELEEQFGRFISCEGRDNLSERLAEDRSEQRPRDPKTHPRPILHWLRSVRDAFRVH